MPAAKKSNPKTDPADVAPEAEVVTDSTSETADPAIETELVRPGDPTDTTVQCPNCGWNVETASP